MGAGSFNKPIYWKVRSLVAVDGNPNKEVFQSDEEAKVLKGKVTYAGSGKTSTLGMLNTQSNVEVRFRQYVQINPLDQLRDKELGYLLIIDDIVYDDDNYETVCLCHKFTEG